MAKETAKETAKEIREMFDLVNEALQLLISNTHIHVKATTTLLGDTGNQGRLKEELAKGELTEEEFKDDLKERLLKQLIEVKSEYR